MNKRDIFLDFTSLLDVTLIIIFFFVLFSHLDSVENAEKTQSKIQEMEVAIEKAEKREALAEEKYQEYLEDIEIVKAANERLAEDTEEIINFRHGRNLKFFLTSRDESWLIRMFQEDTLLMECSLQDLTTMQILTALEENGFTSEDTLLCDVIYDSNMIDSYSAYKKMEKLLKGVRDSYTYFYYSEIDNAMANTED